MEIILPKYHEFLWSCFSYTLQGDRTQVRCLNEINLLQQKMYVQGLLYLSAFFINFLWVFGFFSMLSPPDVYLFSALNLLFPDSLEKVLPFLYQWVLRNGHSKDAKNKLKDTTAQWHR